MQYLFTHNIIWCESCLTKRNLINLIRRYVYKFILVAYIWLCGGMLRYNDLSIKSIRLYVHTQ